MSIYIFNKKLYFILAGFFAANEFLAGFLRPMSFWPFFCGQ